MDAYRLVLRPQVEAGDLGAAGDGLRLDRDDPVGDGGRESLLGLRERAGLEDLEVPGLCAAVGCHRGERGRWWPRRATVALRARATTKSRTKVKVSPDSARLQLASDLRILYWIYWICEQLGKQAKVLHWTQCHSRFRFP